MAGNWSKTPCGIGTIAEMKFAAAAAEQGMGVCLPWGHSHGYDMVIDCDGHLSKIEVKVASYTASRDRYELNTRVTRRPIRGTTLRTPSEGGFDFLVGVASDFIYLFPVQLVVGRSSITLRPPDCRKSLTTGQPAQFNTEDYLYAWHLLKGRG